ncbi:hypothetical protein CYG48_21370 (plasmid) [Neorhizobium sp. SOG26]|uniref:hypothetical protein n=1 Tax=Neorhizobium sp. SOG26 TaxID=2060726 RepID=UPI000E5809E8|nr:hypothetical protein CYG48_21370 [Neorhizobium sp. SOG26]
MRDIKGAGLLLASPVAWLAGAMIPLVILLILPVSIPIGPMYWDTYLYLDAAQRIWNGQVPAVDFLTPVGPLGYYLFAWGLRLFQNAQPLLLAQWCMLVVAVPLMALAAADVARENRLLTLALVVPFLLFAVSPANVQAFHPDPGLDGFGVYNRHAVILLYVMTTGLLFLQDSRKMAVFLAAVMLALFLTKVTGFLVGGLLGLQTILAGKVSLRHSVLAASLFVVALAVLELPTGMISAYVREILQLVEMNDGSMLPRSVSTASAKLDVLIPVGLLVLVLAWNVWKHGKSDTRSLDHGVWWLCVALFGGWMFETQNTGSHEFIFIWPILVMLWTRIGHLDPRLKTTVLVLAAFATIPTATKVAHRTIRSAMVSPSYASLDLPLVKNMQQVRSRADIIGHAQYLETHYQNHGHVYTDLPNWHYYSNLDFQLYWIMSASHAVEAILKFEAENAVKLASLMTLDFSNPFPWLLDRQATKHIQIGAVPGRTVPPMTPKTKEAVEATAGVLRPKCPSTDARHIIEDHYREALASRHVVELTPCWDLLLHQDLAVARSPAAP